MRLPEEGGKEERDIVQPVRSVCGSRQNAAKKREYPVHNMGKI